MASQQDNDKTDRAAIVAALTLARRARHRLGRAQTMVQRARVAALRHQAENERAARLETAEDRRSYAFVRRRRRQEALALSQFWRMIRVKVEPEKRPRFRMICPAKLYARYEYGTGGVGAARDRGPLREVFLQWIGRGLKSGRERGSRRASNARTGRHRPWRPGEAGRMVRYIWREEAVEDVDGALLSNVGADLVECVAYFRKLEEIEALARSDASVYHHAIIALPHDIVPKARARLAARIMKPLEDLGLGYAAALHKPDRDGDQRNYHLHIILSLRPMVRVAEYEWQLAPAKRGWLDTPAGLLLMRRHLAREFNRALAAAGSPTRWTHLSRAERGLASPGNTKRRPGDRQAQAAALAEQKLRDAIRHRDGVERVAATVDQLGELVERMTSTKTRLIELAASASARLAELHRQLLALADRADRAKRRLKLAAAAQERRRAQQASTVDAVGPAAGNRAPAPVLPSRLRRKALPSFDVSQPPAELQTPYERLQALKLKARKIYPEPAMAKVPLVGDFLATLRAVDTPERMAALAAKIATRPDAVADLKRLGSKVEAAYEHALSRSQQASADAKQVAPPRRGRSDEGRER